VNKLVKQVNKFSNFEDGKILIEDFRWYQQQMIDYFLKVVVEYISNKNNNYLTLNRIDHEEIFAYSGLSNNEIDRYSVYVDNPKGETKQFFRLYFPRLIYRNFYVLNGHYYVPLFYIIDKPITIKENSINLNSLFSSITLNIKDGIAVFTGTNLVLNKFVGLFIFNDNSPEADEIKDKLVIKNTEKELVDYFNTVFKLNTDVKGIKNYIELLFFDEYTRYLYSTCYFNDSIEVNNLSDIIKISLIKFFSGKIFNFIDLNNKRICFIELLLAPIFKRAASIAYLAKKGFLADELKIDQNIILKNFLKSSDNKKSKNKSEMSFNGLSGKTLYDLVNLYSSILIHKCSFVKPGMKSPPPSIADIHKTHFGKICPITVSSIKPGETVSIVPETYVDMFGQFLDLE
jgi:hypothetical protein